MDTAIRGSRREARGVHDYDRRAVAPRRGPDRDRWGARLAVLVALALIATLAVAANGAATPPATGSAHRAAQDAGASLWEGLRSFATSRRRASGALSPRM